MSDKTNRYLQIIGEVEREFVELVGAKEWKSEGPCGFLTCDEQGAHAHGTCPTCGAVKFGNVFCWMCCWYQRRVRLSLEGEGGEHEQENARIAEVS